MFRDLNGDMKYANQQLCKKVCIMHFQTHEAAREAGLKTKAEWMRLDKKNGKRQMVPKRDVTPVIVDGVQFYSLTDCEELLSPQYAERCGLILTEKAEHVGFRFNQIGGKTGKLLLYRESDFRAAHQDNDITAEIDLVVAIFTVNVFAKHYLDASQEAYQVGAWDFATSHRKKKELLYELKEKGISAGFLNRRLRFAGVHENLAVYTGDGYSFHSLLLPREWSRELDDTSLGLTESTPKVCSEARLKDAESTLSRLPNVHSIFDRLDEQKQ